MGYDQTKGMYEEAYQKLTIYIVDTRKNKIAGHVMFDVTSVLNDRKNSLKKVYLQKCPDPNAKLFFEISMQKIAVVSHDDYMMQDYLTEIDSKSRASDTFTMKSIDNFSSNTSSNLMNGMFFKTENQFHTNKSNFQNKT